MTNPYLVLGVSPRATQAEITHAYRRQLRDHHPDMRPPAPSGGADERLRQILAAYTLLRDPHRRAAYDRTTEPARTQTGPIQIPVIGDNIEQQPPLCAGPVRWHPD
jgi:DnaJ-class molecular chaperone